jgi:rare lipoprotein A (peptidoglycan hydrolase)
MNSLAFIIAGFALLVITSVIRILSAPANGTPRSHNRQASHTTAAIEQSVATLPARNNLTNQEKGPVPYGAITDREAEATPSNRPADRLNTTDRLTDGRAASNDRTARPFISTLVLFIAFCLFCRPAPAVDGWASWYHPAPGVTNLVCASWFYDIGARLRVTELHNGSHVDVIVVERGPNLRFLPSRRIIDLSPAAFAQLDGLELGLAEVRVEEIKP